MKVTKSTLISRILRDKIKSTELQQKLLSMNKGGVVSFVFDGITYSIKNISETSITKRVIK